MTVLSFDELRALVLAAPCAWPTRVLAIDGYAASGKSTLGRRLARHLGAPLIPIDDFVSWADVAGWWPRYDAQVLTPLLQGRPAHYQARDWVHDELGDSLSEWKTVEPAPLVIVEGVTSTRREAVGRLAYAVWVDAPEPLRLERGVQRDGHPDLWVRWMAEERAFFDSDGTAARADLRINGSPLEVHDPETQVVLR